MTEGLRRWARRARWLAVDTLRCLRGLVRVVRRARRADHPVAIALLEGAAHAVVGQANPYRVRVANDGTEVCRLSVELRGEAAHPAATTLACTLAPRSARDLFFLTDWAGRLEATPEPPAAPDELVLGGVASGSCRLTATLRAGSTVVDHLVIVQPIFR